ncbi:MAG: hypothetical protein SGBAC_005757 [Bacillariaceae sp.]
MSDIVPALMPPNNSAENENTAEPFVYREEGIGTIPQDVTHVTIDSSTKEIKRGAFANCRDLKRVDFQEGLLTTIGNSSFQNCSSLVELEFHDGLDTIAGCAFQNCHSLEQVKVPPTFGRVGEAAFQDCTSLIAIEHLDGLRFIAFKAFAYCVSLMDIQLPEGLTYIGQSAFINCQSLRTISVPSTVTVIWNNTFCGCTSLTEAKLRDGLKTIFRAAFAGCIQLQAIDIPSTVETIEEEAFASCSMLRSVTLRDGLTTVGKQAFSHCKVLSSISVPRSVHSIGNAAFQGCLALVDVELNEGLVGIGISAFSGCNSICGVSLPESLNVLRGTAFEKCSSLLGIEIPQGSDLTIYRDESAFRKLPCFSGCTELVAVSIPSSMEETANFAFSKCSKFHDGDIGEYEPQKLRDRFDALPVHTCCYYASVTTVDDLTEAIDSSISSANEDKLVDVYGMTPFHIAATSARLRADMLKILLDRYAVEVIVRKDAFGKTMMDYLMMQRSLKAIPSIKMTLKSALPRAMGGHRLFDKWRSILLDCVDSTSWEGDNNTRWICYRSIMKHFAHVVKLEATSILELALWKMKIGELLHLESCDDAEVDRTNCRWKCGSDALMENVLKYAWDDQSDVSMASMMLPLCPCIDEP